MSYILYYNPDSANIVIRMALEELGQSYGDREVPRQRDGRDQTFIRLNPRGLLPVLIDGDTPVFETGAILHYLSEKHGRLAPKQSDSGARAEYLKWLFMLSNTLHADLRLRFYTPRFVADQTAIDSVLEMTRQRVVGHLTIIDRAIGEHGGDWFCASGMTVCDIYLGCCVRWAQIYPAGDIAVDHTTFEKLPNLERVLTRMQDLPSIKTALAKEGISEPAFVNVVPHLEKPSSI